jgi:hypothetical protein
MFQSRGLKPNAGLHPLATHIQFFSSHAFRWKNALDYSQCKLASGFIHLLREV